MARINLMPWREKRRKQRHQAFLRVLAASALGAVALLLIGWSISAAQVDRQEGRNKQLTDEINLMKKKVEQIQDLDVKRDRLLGRKRVIEELQSNRSQIVHLFDELIRAVPDGVQLTSIKRAGGFLVVEGRTESSSRVSDYMSRLEASAWLEKTDLQIIEEQIKEKSDAKTPAVDAAALPYVFRIQMGLVNPNQPQDEGKIGSSSPIPTPAGAPVSGLPTPTASSVSHGAAVPSVQSAGPAPLREAPPSVPLTTAPMSENASEATIPKPGPATETVPAPREKPSSASVPGETTASSRPVSGKVN